jgi:hypothetical protein
MLWVFECITTKPRTTILICIRTSYNIFDSHAFTRSMFTQCYCFGHSHEVEINALCESHVCLSVTLYQHLNGLTYFDEIHFLIFSYKVVEQLRVS